METLKLDVFKKLKECKEKLIDIARAQCTSRSGVTLETGGPAKIKRTQYLPQTGVTPVEI